MPSRCFKWMMVIALALSLGSPSVILQSIAWAGMFCSYSQDNSVTVALTMTLDGQHPCRLCKAAEQTRHEEQGQRIVQPELKVDAVLLGSGLLEFPIGSLPATPVGQVLVPALPADPPSPPPRLTLPG